MQQLGNMKESFDDLSDPEQFVCLVGCFKGSSSGNFTYLCSYQLHKTHVKACNKSLGAGRCCNSQWRVESHLLAGNSRSLLDLFHSGCFLKGLLFFDWRNRQDFCFPSKFKGFHLRSVTMVWTSSFVLDWFESLTLIFCSISSWVVLKNWNKDWTWCFSRGSFLKKCKILNR